MLTTKAHGFPRPNCLANGVIDIDYGVCRGVAHEDTIRGIRGGCELGEDFFDDVGVFEAGEFFVETLVFDGEVGVVEAEEVEHGGVEIVDGDDIFDGVVSEFVGGSVGDAAFVVPLRL